MTTHVARKLKARSRAYILTFYFVAVSHGRWVGQGFWIQGPSGNCKDLVRGPIWASHHFFERAVQERGGAWPVPLQLNPQGAASRPLPPLFGVGLGPPIFGGVAWGLWGFL